MTAMNYAELTEAFLERGDTIERLEDSFVVMMRKSEAAHTALTEEVESWQRVAKDLNRELVSAGQIVAERDATLVDLQLAAQKALKDAAHEIALQDVKIERMTYERSHPFGDAIQADDNRRAL